MNLKVQEETDHPTEEKRLPGPHDWGYKRSDLHMRDPHNPEKPITR
jgi:hypothetical protein